MVANVSRYGPYVSYNKQNVSIPKGLDVMEITLEQALSLIEQKAETEKKRVVRSFEGGIDVMNGRYGPYLSQAGKNYRLPKNLASDLEGLTLEQWQVVISKAGEHPVRGRRSRK